MYSPKIDEQVIPQLYYLAKARRMPMTVLVNEIILTGIKTLIDQDRADVEREVKG